MENTGKAKFLRYFALLIAAFVWGTAFVAQSKGSELIKPFTFTAMRAVLGAVVLIPVILIMDGVKKKKGTWTPPTEKDKKRFGSAVLFAAS